MTTTHIRIPKVVKSQLDGLANDNEPVGAVITRLIDYYKQHHGPGEEDYKGVNKEVNVTPAFACRQAVTEKDDALLSIREDIRVLNNLFSYLEGEVKSLKAQTSEIPEIKESISKLFEFVVMFEKWDDIKLNDLDKMDERIRQIEEKVDKSTIPEIHNNKGVNSNVNSCVNSDKISITPDLQKQIIERVDFLKTKGYNRDEIAKLAGINPNSFKGMLGASGTRRTIYQEQLKALMLIDSGDDCEEQEPEE